ncbi:MAG: DMT family transporter, partial [Rhodothermales bacterium]
MITDEPQHDGADGEAAWPHHSLLLTFVMLWGGNFVLAEVALREMDPISFSVSRFLAGGIAMISILYLQLVIGAKEAAGRDRLFPRLRRKDWPRLLVVSVIGATLAPWLGIEGLGLTHGARASLWLALGPVVSCGLGYVMGTERIGWVGYVGIALAALGTLSLAIDGIRPGQSYWVGDILLFLALLMAVAELHLIKPLAARYGATAMVTARTAIGGLFYLLIASPSLVDEPWLTLDMWTWIAILFGGAVGVGVGQWVKVRALKTLGPTRVVLYGNLVPLAALWLAWITIGTIPSTLELLAGFLIVVGAICIQVFDLRMHVGKPEGA